MDFVLRKRQADPRKMVNAGTAIPASRWPGTASNVDADRGKRRFARPGFRKEIYV
jgi:hypothetical protein